MIFINSICGSAIWIRLFLLLFVVSFSFAEIVPSKCPGLYCGRIITPNGTLSDCGACPRGYRPDETTLCIKCDAEPTFYDWLYLGFMAILSLVLHWFFIDFTNQRKTKTTLVILHVSALLESVVAAIITLLLVDPVGSFRVRSCPVNLLSDWYSMLYNPSPNYITTLHCTQEIVYPLYTIVMIYYAFSLLFLMLLRPCVSYKCAEKTGTKSIYAALYFHPILIVLQAVFSGLLYYSFPYIVIVVSVVTSAIHLSSFEDQGSYRKLFKEAFHNVRNLVILVGHWCLHAYGIIAMTQLTNPAVHVPLIALVPFPVLFYIFTVKFSDPNNLATVS